MTEASAGILEDKPRSGRPKKISAEREAAIVEATLNTRPRDATQWSVRTMAEAQKVSAATLYRIWTKHKRGRIALRVSSSATTRSSC